MYWNFVLAATPSACGRLQPPRNPFPLKTQAQLLKGVPQERAKIWTSTPNDGELRIACSTTFPVDGNAHAYQPVRRHRALGRCRCGCLVVAVVLFLRVVEPGNPRPGRSSEIDHLSNSRHSTYSLHLCLPLTPTSTPPRTHATQTFIHFPCRAIGKSKHDDAGQHSYAATSWPA